MIQGPAATHQGVYDSSTRGAAPSGGTSGGSGGGFDPLSILSSAIGSGIPSFTGGSASSSSSNYQDVFSSSPFNVGSGSLEAEATKTPNPQGSGFAGMAESLTPIVLLVAAAWVAVAVISR